MRFPVGPDLSGREGLGAFAGERSDEDVRGGMQIVLCVAAHQLQALREGHVAFDDASAQS
jgi:hypothetical protein